MVQNVITSAMSAIRTVEAGVDLLDVFQLVSAREAERGGDEWKRKKERKKEPPTGHNERKGDDRRTNEYRQAITLYREI